jgi:protein TonB
MDWEDSEVVKVAEVMPEPEEGLDVFLRYIGNQIKYPAEARDQGIEGKVFISFIITKEGFMANVKVEKGIGYGLDEEAVRVVSSYDKKWKPGINQGEKVNTQMVLPINYAL